MATLEDIDALDATPGFTVELGPGGEGRLVNGLGMTWLAMTDADADRVLTQARNRATMAQGFRDGVAYFGGNFRNWGSLTAQQKEQANRNAQKAIANLQRYALNDMTTGGD